VAVVRLRVVQPGMARPFRMWLYPLPALVALLGWIFVLGTSDPLVILFGLGTLMLGVLAFFAWSWRTGHWPFGPTTVDR
jgi:hypothetical protein